MEGEDQDQLLTVQEVAVLFKVTDKTVRRWTASGRLRCIRAPSGRARYPESEIRAMSGAPDASPGPSPDPPPRAGRGQS